MQQKRGEEDSKDRSTKRKKTKQQNSTHLVELDFLEQVLPLVGVDFPLPHAERDRDAASDGKEAAEEDDRYNDEDDGPRREGSNRGPAAGGRLFDSKGLRGVDTNVRVARNTSRSAGQIDEGG